MKPRIKFKNGQWQMDGWARYDGLPKIAFARASLAEALAYFRDCLRCP